jgi:protein-tyrosine phosphatase
MSGPLDVAMAQSNVTVPYTNTYWVVPGTFLAGEHPTELDDNITKERLSALLDAGIGGFVDLTEAHEVKGYHHLLRSLADSRRMEVVFRRVPIRDGGVPSVSTVREILDEIDRLVNAKIPVFVHCFAGLGRTGTVVGCYLRRRGLAAQGEVVAEIKKLRRLMPSGSETSPQTPDQVRMVETWEDRA